MQAFSNVSARRRQNGCPRQCLRALLGMPLLETKRFVRRVFPFTCLNSLNMIAFARCVYYHSNSNFTYPKKVGRPDVHLLGSSKPSLYGSRFRVHVVGAWWTLRAATTVSTCLHEEVPVYVQEELSTYEFREKTMIVYVELKPGASHRLSLTVDTNVGGKSHDIVL